MCFKDDTRDDSGREDDRGNRLHQTPIGTMPQAPSQATLYRKLDFSQKQIRLLVLDYNDSQSQRPIRCSLVQTNLDRAPPFEALSYVWGDPGTTVVFKVGSHTLNITQNLYTTLHHLSKPTLVEKGPGTTSSRRIWIDALCINQDDVHERNEQVRLMFSIYQKAARVLVWLGEERDDSDLAMNLILHLYSEKLVSFKKQVPQMRFTAEEQKQVDFFANKEKWYMSLMKLHGSSDGEHLNPRDPREWVAFQRLMERPWFRRMWVVQELAAAGDRALIGCGTKWIPWNPFVMAAMAISESKALPFLHRLRRLGADAELISGLAAICYRADGRLNNFGGMLLLLFYTKSKQATLPVDRIFALLGFAPSIPILPDYTQRPEQVYKSFVKLFIRQSGLIAILAFNRFPKRLNLPTWTPDFSCEFTDDEYNITVPLGFYGADGNPGHNTGQAKPQHVVETAENDDELTVMGFQYDRVVYLGKPWQGDAEERDSLLFGLLEDYESAVADNVDPSRLRRTCNDNLQDALWRTLCWNATPESRYPAPDNYGEYYMQLTRSNERLGNWGKLSSGNSDINQFQRVIPMEGESRQYYNSLVKHSLNRRIFITSNGSLGSGPSEMRENDLVCILLGSKTPVILRRSNRAQGCFEWVGLAYVHGIMHGESLPEIADRLQSFRLK